MNKDVLNKAIIHLSRDKKLKKLIDKYPKPKFEIKEEPIDTKSSLDSINTKYSIETKCQKKVDAFWHVLEMSNFKRKSITSPLSSILNPDPMQKKVQSTVCGGYFK